MRMHRTEMAHAMHLPHPLHWLHEHSMARNILLAATVALLLFGMARLFMMTPEGIRLPAMYPYGPVY